MKLIGTTAILLIHVLTFGQSKSKPDVYGLPIPKNIEGCFALLDETLSDAEIYLVKTLEEDSIYFNPAFRYGADFFHAWKIYKGSKLTKYFNKKGLYGSFEVYEAILVSYHRYLNHDSIKLDEQIKKYQDKQKQDYLYYISKTEKDSLYGYYIPRDLPDCFIQLDKILSEKDKTEIKHLKDREETIQYHDSHGRWLRNNWGLWGGSRLQKYFFNKKVSHPDDISMLILKFYYDWLNHKNEGWQKWAQ